jgi:hypothetical protein
LYELVAVQPQNLVTIKSWLEKKQAMGAMGCLDNQQWQDPRKKRTSMPQIVHRRFVFSVHFQFKPLNFGNVGHLSQH